MLLVAAARSLMAEGAEIADFGSGVGAVGLSLALCGAGRALLVEIDPTLGRLAEENARENGLEDRSSVVVGDVAKLGLADGLAPESLDLVAANPPFDDLRRHRVSPDAAKAVAHGADEELMERWTKAAARMLKPGGVFVIIHRAEALGDLLAVLGNRFGDIRVRPVHPNDQAPAARVLVAGRKGRRGALALLPALVMHRPDGRFTEEADAAQRGDVVLMMS
ncbi:methyltransferase domain-containing protein [Hansschlegelia quercus]|uniref:Methyltransferase domain-containing protein n=2 Tax=Hansschlegelia quercus TaxID=2528245 RepID=A0A4Q9GT12_9HYPH|nr:methyltransferase domain-containing protein [Hansschlegelia quercus]